MEKKKPDKILRMKRKEYFKWYRESLKYTDYPLFDLCSGKLFVAIKPKEKSDRTDPAKAR